MRQLRVADGVWWVGSSFGRTEGWVSGNGLKEGVCVSWMEVGLQKGAHRCGGGKGGVEEHRNFHVVWGRPRQNTLGHKTVSFKRAS
jgi:hypothetical protein